MRTWAPLVVAIATFWALGGWYTQVLGSWHEEESVYPSVGYRILEEPSGRPGARAPAPRFESSCDGAAAPHLVRSSERPELSLCAGGREYPLMITPYFAGYFYWPTALFWRAHHGDVFALRVVGLVLGSASLVLTWMLVRRLADATVAGASAVLTAVSSSFAYAHALLVHYEFLPWLFLAAAIVCLLRCVALAPDGADERVPTRWWAAAALATGLAVGANLKALFLAVPLAALSVRLGVRWRRVRFAQWALAAPLVLAPALPMLLFAACDPGDGFAQQVHRRVGLLVAPRLLKLLTEPLNLAVYWTDVAAYFDVIAGAKVATNWPAIVLAWAALLYGAIALARAVVRRRARDLVAAGAAALVLSYVLVSALLYDQQVSANYAPLHSVFGVALGSAAVAAGRSLRRRLGARGAWPVLAPAAVIAAVLVDNDLRRGSPAETQAIAINAAAQRSLAEHLRATAGDATLVTTTYNLAGVLESLGHGALRPVQAQRYLLRCGHDGDPTATEACMVERWTALLEAMHGPVRVVAPTHASVVDEPATDLLVPTLEQAARRLGLAVARERDFTTGRGVPVLTLWHVG